MKNGKVAEIKKIEQSSLQEMINECKILRANKLPINFESSHAIYNLFSSKYYKKTFEPTILVWNINRVSELKMKSIHKYIIDLQPDIIFLIECWQNAPNLTGYIKYTTNDVYYNQLYIKSDRIRNRPITFIECGILVDDIAFRYIPPLYKNRINLMENEIGDYNFLSHNWIDNSMFEKENRLNNIGGTGCKLIYDHDVKFIKSLSDHHIMIIKIKENWKKTLKTDPRKLDIALHNSLITGRLEYFYSDQKLNRSSNNFRKVNPNIIKLDEWVDIYGNDPKYIERAKLYQLGNKCIERTIGTNAYDNDDYPLKPISKFIKENNLNLQQTSNIIKALNQYPPKGRIIPILKKGHKLINIKDIRPICILPVSMRLAEETRIDIINGLPIHKAIYAFRPGFSIHSLFYDFFNEFKYN